MMDESVTRSTRVPDVCEVRLKAGIVTLMLDVDLFELSESDVAFISDVLRIMREYRGVEEPGRQES